MTWTRSPDPPAERRPNPWYVQRVTAAAREALDQWPTFRGYAGLHLVDAGGSGTKLGPATYRGSRASYWLARVHRKANMSCLVSSRWWGSGERARGPVDQVDDDRMCGVAGADRRNGFLPAHAHARCAPWPAGVGCGADSVVGGRDDRGRVDDSVGGLGSGSRGGRRPWALLVVGSVASLAANVAVAQPNAIGRVIAAWPSFALIGAYELLMRQVRVSAVGRVRLQEMPQLRPVHPTRAVHAGPVPRSANGRAAGRSLRQDAWQWAEANRADDGSLPSGRKIARQYGRHERWAQANCAGYGSLPSGRQIGRQFDRHERWGRLVKRSGCAGEFASGDEPGLRLVEQHTAPSNTR